MQTDPADSPHAAMVDHPSEHILQAFCSHCRHEVDSVCPDCGGMVEASGVPTERLTTQSEEEAKFATLAAIISSKRSAKFWWACFLIAIGDASASGVSMEELADRWKTTRQKVSKTAIAICGILGRPPSPYMKSEAARESSRLHNVRGDINKMHA